MAFNKNTVSATQVETFELCPRKWYESYVLGNKQPFSDSFQIGGEVHSDLEHYLNSGTVKEDKWSELVKQAIPHLPEPPVQNASVEEWFEIPTYEGGPIWNGKADLYVEGKVYDHKTCKNFSYVKTPEELANSVQMTAYAWWAFTEKNFLASGSTSVKLIHTYLKVQGKPKVVPVEVEVSYEQVRDRWHRSLDTVRKMREWIEKNPPKSEELPPNKNACKAFGGCHVLTICGFTSPFEGLRSTRTMSEEKSKESMKEMMARIRAAAKKVERDINKKLAECDRKMEREAVLDAAKAEGRVLPPDAPSRETPVLRCVPLYDQIAASVKTVESPAAVSSVVQDNTTEAPKPSKEKKPKTSAQNESVPVKSGPTLFIDVHVMQGEDQPVPMEKLLAPVLDKLAKAHNVSHYGLIPYHSRALLGEEVGKMELPPSILINSRLPTSDVVLEVLTPIAGRIFRGFGQ